MRKVSRLVQLASIDSLVPATNPVKLAPKSQQLFARRLSSRDAPRTSAAKVKSIVVPLDGSRFAEQAIPLALGLAEQSGARLDLMHVVVPADVLNPYDVPSIADVALKSLKRDKRHYLNGVREKIAASSPACVAAHVVSGRAIPATLDELTGCDAGLVVMATHGRGIWGRFWWGSVAHTLLQRVSVPAIFVRGADGPVTFEPTVPNHVLLPIEQFEISQTVLGSIIEQGLYSTARHSLLHTVPLVPPVPSVPQFVVKEYGLGADWVPSWSHWSTGMRQLSALAQILRDAGRRVHTKVVSTNEPFAHLALQWSKQNDADLIALPYCPQWSLGRLFCPNTAEYLFRHSSRPIMFVPSNRD